MSNTTLQMRNKPAAARHERAVKGAPTWWIIFTRELIDMWVGGKGLVLMFVYCVILGLLSYVMASNNELDLIPPEEMVFLILQTALSVGGFIAAIIGADSISGERERATLEALLITPSSRFQIVLGKLLAAITPWPAAMLTTIPYLQVLSQGEGIWRQAVLWGFVFGTLLTVGYTGIGMLASMWSASNRTSLGVSLLIYIMCALPVQFPGSTQTGVMGRFLKAVNPMEATDHVLEKLLVNNRTLSELTTYLISPILLPLLVLGVLLLFAAPRLRLDAGLPWSWRTKGVKAASILALVALLGFTGTASATAAPLPHVAAQASAPVAQLPLEITIDTTAAVVKSGDEITYHTVVKNNDTTASPPLILAMNIINLDAEGDVVDPEDWSPQRTQYLEALEPGESAQQEWNLNTILGGDYMVYMVLIPAPGSPEISSWPLTSAGIHVTVEVVINANPGGVAPYAIGMPSVLLAAIVVINLYRRRQTSGGVE
ncbi:MAG: ABC transporter permease subunit [Caldilineaceae bacterium]